MPCEFAPSADVRLQTGPSIAIDPADGTIYVAYSAATEASNQVETRLARSHDGGQTWSRSRLPMSTRGDAAIPFQPAVVVDEEGGVDVSYFVLAHGLVDVELVRSTNRGGSWDTPQRVTDEPFDPAHGMVTHNAKQGSWWIGDYQGLAVSSGVIHPFWNGAGGGQLELFTRSIPIGRQGTPSAATPAHR